MRLHRCARDLAEAVRTEDSAQVDSRLAGLAIVAARCNTPEALASIERLRALPRWRHHEWRQEIAQGCAYLGAAAMAIIREDRIPTPQP